jgi:pSer/pThr/pTyr-binding forkhead associated (FHA) protein
VEAVIVEVLSRFGQVRSRQRLSTFPATLGRAYNCDVILDEADVSSVHARITRSADGLLLLEDAGSTNGLRHRRKKVQNVPLHSGTEVRLGSAHVRFVALDEKVPKTQLYRTSRLDRWTAVGVGFVLFALTELFTDWWLKATRVHFSEVVETVLGVSILFVGGWAFIWSLASRVAHGRSKVVGHLAAGFFAFAGLNLGGVLPGYVAAVLRLNKFLADNLLQLTLGSVLGWLLFQNLSRVVAWSRRRILITVAVMAALAYGLGAVAGIASEARYDAGLPISDVAQPPSLLLGPVSADADLKSRMASLQAAAEKEKRAH